MLDHITEVKHKYFYFIKDSSQWVKIIHYPEETKFKGILFTIKSSKTMGIRILR